MLETRNPKKIIVYRFHEGLSFHEERIKILRHFNPNIPIHIFAGGAQPRETRDRLGKIAESYSEHPCQDGDWRWRSGDLMLRDWFCASGKDFDFDLLYDFEWDVLLTDSIESAYPVIPGDTLALTGIDDLAAHDHHWYWTTEPKQKQRAMVYFRFMAEEHGMQYPSKFCFWPGAVLPRSYLKKLHELSIPNDIPVIGEITTPMIAEHLGFHVIDTNLMPKISRHFLSPIVSPFFHTESAYPVRKDFLLNSIEEVRRRNEPVAFHPVKELVTLEEIVSAKEKRAARFERKEQKPNSFDDLPGLMGETGVVSYDPIVMSQRRLGI